MNTICVKLSHNFTLSDIDKACEFVRGAIRNLHVEYPSVENPEAFENLSVLPETVSLNLHLHFQGSLSGKIPHTEEVKLGE